MRLLGAVLAGGASSRFGTDKAAALVDGRALLDHVIAALRPQVDEIAVVARDWPGLRRIDDQPRPGLGPLGGLCGALEFAGAGGFAAVLCVPCDMLHLPADLAARLSPGPAVAVGQRVIGLWPAALAPSLRKHLASDGSRAVRHWVASSGAREVDCGALANINEPAALVEALRRPAATPHLQP
jgi:molybdopterin-guanine dinucleotide biosynthesis protein A